MYPIMTHNQNIEVIQIKVHSVDQMKTGNTAIIETQSNALLPVPNKWKTQYLVNKDLSLSEDGVLRNSNQPKMPSFGLKQDCSLIGGNIRPIRNIY